MSQYLTRVLKALTISSIGLGGGVGLLIMIVIIINHKSPDAFDHAWRWGLLIGIVFGVFVIAVLLPLDLFTRLFLAKGKYKDIWQLHQEREIRIEGTSKEVLAISREALLKIGNVNSVSDDSEQMVTHATTGVSFRSPGELMEVEINPVTEKLWMARCTSKPKSKYVLFDYGKNFENVETWLYNVATSAHTVIGK